ncbi:MAG: hypothetical protein K9K82_10460 [Desulfobacteraceae bacterium]|nr:hypothetical protein [Desulfobacteraceae bacterium]
MTNQEKDQRIIEWLGQPENDPFLDRLARIAVNRLQRDNLLTGLLGEESAAGGSAAAGYHGDPSGRETVDAVKSELFIFLAENRKIQEVMAAGHKESGGYLLNAFHNHCREKARSISVSPRKYFRRTALALIRETEALSSASEGTGAGKGYATIYGKGPCREVLAPLSDEDRQQIPFTLECQQVFSGARKNALCNRKALFHALCWFLDQARERRQSPGSWVSLEAFLDWLMANRPPNLPIGPDMHNRHFYPDSDGEPVSFEEMLPDNSSRPDQQWYDPEPVASWAKMCVALLTREEQSLLYQKLVLHLNARQISENRGDISRNTVDNRSERALDKIRSFLADKQWVSFDDLNEKAFHHFMEKLNHELKNACLTPYEDQ